MKVSRVFTETQDVKSLIIQKLEKEVDRILSATYNGEQVGMVAFTNGGRQQ